jgi:hypothetical protein
MFYPGSQTLNGWTSYQKINLLADFFVWDFEFRSLEFIWHLLTGAWNLSEIFKLIR